MNRSSRLALCLCLLACSPVAAQEAPAPGLRVFTAGHSFHVFISPLLASIAEDPVVKDHHNAGMHFIGGSRVIQHWNVSDEKNRTKELLGKGQVDVLTLSPVLMPDPGIDNFVALALQHNPDIRITVQSNWLPWDKYDPVRPLFPRPTDHNAATVEKLQQEHTPYFESVDKQVRQLNQTHGKPAVLVVPIGQAVIALRKNIIQGTAPGIKQQEQLFADPMGHPHIQIMLLNTYCHYAVIYQLSPVGLPVPPILGSPKNEDVAKLNTLLQEIAWKAVKAHPLSGVK